MLDELQEWYRPARRKRPLRRCARGSPWRSSTRGLLLRRLRPCQLAASKALRNVMSHQAKQHQVTCKRKAEKQSLPFRPKARICAKSLPSWSHKRCEPDCWLLGIRHLAMRVLRLVLCVNQLVSSRIAHKHEAPSKVVGEPPSRVAPGEHALHLQYWYGTWIGSDNSFCR